MIRRVFLNHPASVGEGYAEHGGGASRYGLRMIAGGLGALVHAVFPSLCETTGSRTIAALHAEMVAKRGAVRADQVQVKSVEYVI